MGKEILTKSFNKNSNFFLLVMKTQVKDVIIGIESFLYRWKAFGM